MLEWILFFACIFGTNEIPDVPHALCLQEEEEAEKPPEYPQFTALEKDKFKRILIHFKNKNPEKRMEAELEMNALGRGAVPHLIKKSSTKHADQLACILNCLAALTDERDRLTFIELYDSKVDGMRLLAVVKIAGMMRPDQKEFLKEALNDKNAEVRLEAALGLAFLKDPSGIGEIILNVAKQRKSPPPRLLEPLPKLKNKTYESMFAPYLLEHKDPEVRIAAVKVITATRDKSLQKLLNKALYDSHNLVQTATVNGLRELVDGLEPKKYGNIFELVEEVNEWKKRLGPIR